MNVFVVTLGGLSDPGYSLWSSLFQRCINLITIGLLKSTNWKPVTLAPPCMNLSREISLKPCRDREREAFIQKTQMRKHRLMEQKRETDRVITIFNMPAGDTNKCHHAIC